MADRETRASAGGGSPIPAEPEAGTSSAVLDDRESLRRRTTAAEQQRDEYLSLLQRSRADFDNYQKRVRRDQAEGQRHALGSFARELLPVLDNLERALEAARGQAESGPLIQGVALVQSNLQAILGRSGVTPIDALDQPFDPNVHEAVMQRPRSDVSPGTVVEVLEPGYRLHERVLRPAKVVVAAPPPPEGGSITDPSAGRTTGPG
jgi:molecular chaperone GrpE